MRGKERKFEYDSWRRNTLIVYKCHNLEIENMERLSGYLNIMSKT